MAPRASQAARRAKAKARPVEARSFAIAAYAALSGNYLTTVQTSRDESVQEMLGKICDASGRDAEETALLYNGGRLDTASTLRDAGIVADAVLQVMAVPRPIKTVKEMSDVFERHCAHKHNAGTRQDPVRLSFLVQDWEGMEGEFVARIIGDNESSPPATKNLRIYTPDGSLYCYANVSTHACRDQQWVLDGRPVFLKVKSFGTYLGSSVNPRNGHMTSCACADCASNGSGHRP